MLVCHHLVANQAVGNCHLLLQHFNVDETGEKCRLQNMQDECKMPVLLSAYV